MPFAKIGILLVLINPLNFYYLGLLALIINFTVALHVNCMNLQPTFSYEVEVNESDINPYSRYSISTSIHKYGWIFCSATGRDCTYFLLFSPFTKKSIKLPPSYWGKPSHTTFSIDPNSPDCVFLLLFDNATEKRITIKTYCRKYKNWRSRAFDFDRPENFGYSRQFPVCIAGVSYFVFPIGKLASFNVDSCEWKIENVIGYDIFPKNSLLYDIYEVFELNGELMLVCIQWDHLGFVARFDWSEKAWVRLESLGNHSLFCSTESIFVSPIGNEERNKGVLPNKIYYRRWNYIYVYSFEQSGKLSTFMDNRSGIRSWDEIAYPYWGYSYNWFEPPHLVKEKLPWDFWRQNNPKKSEMDQTGKQSIDEEDDDELESMRMLDQMRRQRNVARDNNTASIKLYDTGNKRNLRANI